MKDETFKKMSKIKQEKDSQEAERFAQVDVKKKKADEEMDRKMAELEELKMKLDEEINKFESVMVPLKRDMEDSASFFTDGRREYHIIATANKRVYYSIRGEPNVLAPRTNIYQISDVAMLKCFLNRIEDFEEFYLNNIERYS